MRFRDDLSSIRSRSRVQNQYAQVGGRAVGWVVETSRGREEQHPLDVGSLVKLAANAARPNFTARIINSK